MKKWLWLLAGLTLLPGPMPATSASKKPVCKGNPEVVGECFTVHGRLFASNGTPSIRIWRVGTKRILGVTDGGGPETPGIPDNLSKRFRAFENQIYGDFAVCPFSKEKPGEMRSVCIESASHLVVKKIPGAPPK